MKRQRREEAAEMYYCNEYLDYHIGIGSQHLYLCNIYSI